MNKEYRLLRHEFPTIFSSNELGILRSLIHLSPETLASKLATISIMLREIGLGNTAVLSILLYDATHEGQPITTDTIEQHFGASVAIVVKGLRHVSEIHKKNSSIESENFRKLMLTLADDVRVILIILAERTQLMRSLKSLSPALQQSIAAETSVLYAPLAHRLGLYAIKTEMEDLSLKYSEPDTYKGIALKLSQTKRHRDAYIAEFIQPLKEKFTALGFSCSIKGRTKSIHSINNKIKKQNKAFEQIYDLFAIRIIIDTPIDLEKAQCWQAYSIIADMYQPNPKRMRDWLSIPKSNGYESLHTTVLGPDKKWVEVQIRSRRMDEIAEKGLAAHWKYKGGESEKGMDEFLTSIREILENPSLNAVDFMEEFKLHIYDKEVFVFTPGGDLHKLPKGATALDFAFAIHSNVGAKCVGAIVNGKNQSIRYELNNGDQLEILTSTTQSPKQDWLQIVKTSKAKSKIRQALKENENKDAEQGRESLVRRFKNWKIDLDDGRLSRTAKKIGYKANNDLYKAIAQGRIELIAVRDAYNDIDRKESTVDADVRSAENYKASMHEPAPSDDVLVIDKNLKNIDYTLAKCCNPIYGDDVFGFVSIGKGIKIHRTNCPNAPQMMERFGYRIVRARWSGKAVGSQYPITLRVIGNDDIGIVTNITSIISKEKNTTMRSISIDSTDGLFQGHLTLLLSDTNELESIIKKISTVRGVKNIERL